MTQQPTNADVLAVLVRARELVAQGWRWLRRVAEFIDAMEEEATRHDHANR